MNLSENLNNKFKNINEEEEKNLNEMIIIYMNNKNNTQINLFGEIFVKNNKDNCVLTINNKKYKL